MLLVITLTLVLIYLFRILETKMKYFEYKFNNDVGYDSQNSGKYESKRTKRMIEKADSLKKTLDNIENELEKMD